MKSRMLWDNLMLAALLGLICLNLITLGNLNRNKRMLLEWQYKSDEANVPILTSTSKDCRGIKVGMTPTQVSEIMEVNPDFEWIRGTFYNTERYFIWKLDTGTYLLVSFSMYNKSDRWEVLRVDEQNLWHFEPTYNTGGRYFTISIPRGEYWIDFPNKYELNWQGRNMVTWIDVDIERREAAKRSLTRGQ